MVRKRLMFALDHTNTVKEENNTCDGGNNTCEGGNNTCEGGMCEMCRDDSSACVVDGPCVHARVRAGHVDPDPHEKQLQDQNCAIDSEVKVQPTQPAEDAVAGSRSCDHDLPAGEPHNTRSSDAEVARRAQEEGLVKVVFPGQVSKEGSCRFVTDIIKFILYQRQQLPMTYDQLMHDQKKRPESIQDKDRVSQRSLKPADMDRRKQQKVLQDLEELMRQLEVLFSLSKVPRVLLLLGGSVVLPTEMYEINMEELTLACGDQCLRVPSCLRQLFRTIFVADFLLDAKPVRLMSTTVLALAHRDCGVDWFRPKLQFKIPTRVQNKVIALSTGDSGSDEEWEDYVWFQAPAPIKGFS